MTIEEARDRIIGKGFPYFKIELEAVIEWDYREDMINDGVCSNCAGTGTRKVACRQCYGHGKIICDYCKGKGKLIGVKSEEIDCKYCDHGNTRGCNYCKESGLINARCDSCNGKGNRDIWDDDNFSWLGHEFFKRLSSRIRESIVYSSIYHDQSVTVELTMTLPTSEIVNIQEIIDKFATACKKCGNLRDENTGLHIALLTSPCYPTIKKLPYLEITNFKKNVNKLLLAMLILGSDGERTRSFRFRDLMVSDDVKYSAIYTVKDTIIEYRLFDPCFHKPWRAITYVKTIAATLKYYSTVDKGINLPTINLVGNGTSMIKKEFNRGIFTRLSDVFRNQDAMERLRREWQVITEKRIKNKTLAPMNKSTIISILSGAHHEP